MNAMMIIGAVVGGLLGVALWVGVGIAGYEVGWIAWGIGVVAGFGTRMFNRTDTSLGGLSAAVIAGLMVLLGKFCVYKAVVPAGIAFSAMFGGWDILWLVLACGTAARLGFVGEGD